jgi:hypothetical protein
LGQGTSSKPTYNHDGKIDELFDAATNETTVRLDTMKIFSGESESLSMVVTGTFSGKTPSLSPTDLLMVFSVSSSERRFEIEPIIVITADSEIVRNRQAKNYGSRKEGDRVIEPLFNMIPYEVVVKMANAKRVVVKIGASEYELTPNNLEALREFVSKVSPQQ